MTLQDKTLTCHDCSRTFTFTTSEQESFQSKGHVNDPKRCPACREARHSDTRVRLSNDGLRQMHPATCAQCGKQTQVPFEPRAGRPVYCSDCYDKLGRRSVASR